MASTSFMSTNNGLRVLVTATWDENDSPCFTIQHSSNNYFLTCHDDDKHMWWNETDDPWNWEHFYPVKIKDNTYKFKSFFDSFFYGNESPDTNWVSDGDFWQAPSASDTYLLFKGVLPTHIEDIHLESSFVTNDSCKTSSTSSSNKAKLIFDEHHSEFVHKQFNDLQGKEKTHAIKHRLKEMYKSLSTSEKSSWKARAALLD